MRNARNVRGLSRNLGSLILIALLALGFLGACTLLFVHLATAEKIEFSVCGESLLVAVLAVEGIVAVHHLSQARLDSVHHVLEKVLEDYRSPEMLLALNSLWRFRRTHGDRFAQAYIEEWRKDDERIAQLPASEQLEATAATLHHRRRLVKEYYNLLAGLYELGVLPRDVLYTYWSEGDLKIIPEILIPLETAVAQELRTEHQLGGWYERLQRLYDDRR